MDRDEKYLARVLFANKVYGADGEAFQRLFWSVMRAKHGDEFVEVRPQGRLGDGGNDGFLPTPGHYFQVYAPVDPSKRSGDAASKLKEDFEKLVESWNERAIIRAYSFVFNEKYRGIPKETAQALTELDQAQPSVRCRFFTAADLEDEFIHLPTDQVERILGGMLPDPKRIGRLDYGALREAIDFIMSSPTSEIPARFDELPELGEKIQLNRLCPGWADVIRRGARQSGHVDRYFFRSSQYTKQALRDRIVEVYRAARDELRDEMGDPKTSRLEDLVFARFYEQLKPENATVALQSAVDVLVGFYFEACDIFDPHAEKDSASASP